MDGTPAFVPASSTGGSERPPRLALRFAIYTGIVLLVVGAGILWVFERDVEGRAEHRTEAQTQVVADAALRSQLRLSDFSHPLPPARRRQLDAFFRDRVFAVGFVRATLFDRNGVVTYATDRSLIGTRRSNHALSVALNGRASRAEETTAGEKVLRTFVPVRRSRGGHPIGALALAQDYRIIDLQIREAITHSGAILGLALLALWASLIPILRRTTRQLQARNRELAEHAGALAETLAKREAAEQQVRELAAIVESSDDAIVGTDLDGRIISWNGGAERLFGFPARKAVGQSIAIVVPHERRDEIGEILARLRAGEAVDHLETVRRRNDGHPVDVSLTISPIRNAAGDVTGTASIARDITMRRRYDAQREALLAKERAARADAETAQRALAEQNERLRELDRLKDEFISLVSHELRTPLTSIHGYLELLLDGGVGELDEEQARFLSVVERNSRRLMQLVGDLLFMAQVEAGKLTLDVAAVDLGEIARECVEAAQPLADDRQIELVANADATPILGDRSRLAQVLDNLISNALKFTRAGGRVCLRVLTEGDEAVVDVEDTGVGIPADEQARLFERFFRSSNATEQAVPGTGLGLTIAKTIVERHGGSISVESAEGAGTSVTVRLPVRTRAAVAEEVAA